MQTTHFSQGAFVEYRDNYYIFPKPLIYSALSVRTYEGYAAFISACACFATTNGPHTRPLCNLTIFPKAINFIASFSELTYERHNLLPASPAEENCHTNTPSTVQTRKEETAACNKTIQNKDQKGE